MATEVINLKSNLYDIDIDKRERALLVALDTGRNAAWTPDDILDELEELVITAGGEVDIRFVQKRPKPDVATYIGQGKTEEISAYCQSNEIDLVVIAHDLSPRQKRNLEEVIPCKVVDRTEIILDIFAQRAQSKEGKLQVELAQMNYLLPQLTGKGTALSRLGGGIGTRGPGETKLETDRRHIRSRIYDITKEIDEIKKHRSLHRSNRKDLPIHTVSLVGYTNAGKSTLLNYLTGAGVVAEDKLFATLDPTTRHLTLPHNLEALLSDTVGFIHNLPPHLIAAFRATLEELIEADILLHVVDVSHPKFIEHIHAVMYVLQELDISDKKIFTALNKIDRLEKDSPINKWSRDIPDSYPISSKTGEGIPALLEAISNYLQQNRVLLFMKIPYDKGDILAHIHNQGEVLTEDFTTNGTFIKAYIQKMSLKMLEPYVVQENEIG